MSLEDDLKESFLAFANQGKGTGGAKKETMDNKAWSKCCKDCKVQDKSVSSPDVDIVFSKVKTKGTNAVTFAQFKQALIELTAKKFKVKDVKQVTDEQKESTFKLIAGKGPGLSGVTKISKTGGVEKMTDASQYTGSHKERFDASGKGKGLEGREDIAENSGYVGNYSGSGTYDSTARK